MYGQCTWFAWGRFYELYGYSPGFIGDCWKCVDQLLKTHGDKFERSTTPKPGAVFSGIGRNHVGIVIAVDGDTLTIQDGNLDGKTNTFKEAQTDWHTKKYTLSQLRTAMQGVVFANPK
ncbi:CHAP domain-containing protein [Thomasclavelia sp.]|uniref:CHAP domain-containing protein n=1 Tax=Thomasclavelia sp. TaxID=3025757 RepID=UPI0026245037|nr:CHAP domain-containing protein [Thomasclavelia sp.]